MSLAPFLSMVGRGDGPLCSPAVSPASDVGFRPISRIAWWTGAWTDAQRCASRCAVAQSRRCSASPRRFGLATIALLTVALAPVAAHAYPGQAVRLGGIGPQGPASRSVTALHHNPAMLATLRRAAFHLAVSTAAEQQITRRYEIDRSTGEPTDTLAARTSVVQPGFDYFIGGSLHFDPVAIGAGVYSIGTTSRLVGTERGRYHLADDPDRGCLSLGTAKCAPNGGQVSYRHDITAAVAYDGGTFQLGFGLHLPMVRERFAFDEDTALGSDGTAVAECADKEDPTCAERVGFKGWTQWLPPDGAPAGFDAMLSFGAAVQLANETITLGAHYRTFPVRRAGEVALSGVALVCRPAPESEDESGAAACGVASPIRATLRQRVPQEVALGASFALGRARDWKLDLNMYWLDLCQGGGRRASCRDDGGQALRLVGLDRRAFSLPEFTRYRGLQDLYGIDAYVGYRAHARATVLLAGHASTSPVRRTAATVGASDGARVGLSAGAAVRVRGRGGRVLSLLLTPGYGIDLVLPRHVRPNEAAYSPAAAAEFAASDGDINAPGAADVLAGRARSTNAGRYFGVTHSLSLAISWGDGLAD